MLPRTPLALAMRRPAALALALFVAAWPGAARAQLFDAVGGLFDSVNSIAFYTTAGALSSDADVEGTVGGFGVGGVGLEIFLDLPALGDNDFELGLGASGLSGITAREPSLDLRAAVRSLPTFAVYAAGIGVDSTALVEPYLGLQFGVAALQDARGYNAAGAVYEVTAETFELGGTAGAYVNGGPFEGLYVEVGYRRRKFASLAWDADALPAGWPRAIDASTWQATVGWQFRIK